MKKTLCIILAFVFTFLLCGCANDTNSNSNTEKTFSQEVTIVKMPSPPKCKTTNSNAVVNEVIDVLGLMEKEPIEVDTVNGGWYIMVKLNIDGKKINYTIGNIFTDADGKHYKVNNYREIEEKLTKIYNELDVPEVDYP